MNNVIEMIIEMSYPWFKNQEVTSQSIEDFIERMQSTFPDQNIDKEYLFNILEARHTVSVSDEPIILEDLSDHKKWFNPDTNAALERELEWHYWDHYRQYLHIEKNWNKAIIEGVNYQSSLILSKLEDPKREGPWDRRGIVVGSVQSGKTANYTALITKAADVGYKFIVVMAGVHNSLRSQTQFRLNQEFLGYDLKTDQDLREGGAAARIGVGKMFPNTHNQVFTLTHSGEDGDFKRDMTNYGGVFPSPSAPPFILIIKKNVTILRNLIEWITSIVNVRDTSFLLIDDECDYASVNTKEPDRDQNGEIIREWEPAKTNMRIRQLLNLFRKSAYVGYSATPFANIFIHYDNPHPEFGEDLFPRSFVISLPQPTNYIGPEVLFGLDENLNADIEESNPLPLIRIVEDHDQNIPARHRTDLIVDDIPQSMTEAIKSFLLVCAARRIRQEGSPHNSMLVHVTRYTIVQLQLDSLIRAELNTLSARIMSGTDDLSDFKEIWERDFQNTTNQMKSLGFRDAELHSWYEIRANLYETTRRIQVKLLNGLSTDTLDYRLAELRTQRKLKLGESVAWEDRGVSLIAIGGDKLSRGLTLDGLSVSYYLRVSTMYDTLMQMGRWFGYRDGYNDLCRIYTQQDLCDWYRFIAGAMIELRNELKYMALQDSDPMHFGLRVRNHPGRLSVTSAQKSRDAERILISFEGRSQETVVFNTAYSENNKNALENLVLKLDPGNCIERKGSVSNYHWKKVSSYNVIEFLQEYKTHEGASRIVNPQRHASYIARQNEIEELTEWDVVLISKASSENIISISGAEVGCVTRNALDFTVNKISIRRLLDPSHQMLDLTEQEKEEAERKSGTPRPSPEIIRSVRPKHRGLLLIYMLCGSCGEKHYGDKEDVIIGYGLSFPYSDTAVAEEFFVNPVYSNSE